MTDGWKELESGDVIKLEAGEQVNGKFVLLEESRTYKDSYALTLETPQGQKVLFVSNIVKDLLQKNGITPGQEIAVMFKGMRKNKAGTAEYKDYSVMVRN